MKNFHTVGKKFNNKTSFRRACNVNAKLHFNICSGSHGKTSTSTFLSTLLELCTHNSSSITGGIIPIYNSNCHLGNTKFLVAEVDESDGTINKYKSDIGIINNIVLIIVIIFLI